MQKYIKILFGIILLAFSLMLTNCDSPLSDEPLNNPALIAPSLTIERTYDNSKALKGEAIAFIWDKNFNLVRIKDGGVSVNGTDLILEYLITGGPYYETTGNYPVYQNTIYTMTVEMSNGDTYDSEVRTQFHDLHTFNIPATFSHTDSIHVSWEEIVTCDTMWIEFSYIEDDDSGIVNVGIPQDSVDTGGFTITHNNFDELAGKSVQAKLISEKFGTENSHFKIGAMISSKYTVIKECQIN